MNKGALGYVREQWRGGELHAMKMGFVSPIRATSEGPLSPCNVQPAGVATAPVVTDLSAYECRIARRLGIDEAKFQQAVRQAERNIEQMHARLAGSASARYFK